MVPKTKGKQFLVKLNIEVIRWPRASVLRYYSEKASSMAQQIVSIVNISFTWVKRIFQEGDFLIRNNAKASLQCFQKHALLHLMKIISTA